MLDNRGHLGRTVLFVITAILCGCGSPKVHYLNTNIHAQRGAREIKASYANWVGPGAGHMVIPVNTPVQTGRWRGGFYFITLDTKRRVYFELNQRNALATPKEYIALITSPTEVPLDGLSDMDRKGIRAGKAYVGMSKKGVRIALGHPAAHMTSSLEENTWTYWKTRHRRMRVVFDAVGNVSRIF